MFNATDQIILYFDAAMEAMKMQEESVISGASDDDDEEVEPTPTRKEALQAALLLIRYTIHFNDPYARELESMLYSFGKWTRTKDTQNRDS